MKYCCQKIEPLPVGECQPGPSGLGSVRVMSGYLDRESDKTLRDSMPPMSLDSEFAVPVGGGVYQIKTARQILEEEKGQAKDLAKSLLKRR